MALAVEKTDPFLSFRQKIAKEFINESAIAPSVYESAIKFHRDLEIEDGEASTPIHDALGWHYTRFGRSANSDLFAAFFVQETGEYWQAKLSKPLIDAKGKTRKYETPKGNGSRAYLPIINRECRREIAKRFDCEVPPCGESFWQWLEHHPEIPIVLTEGGKKGLCLLSFGYVTIALTGVNGGYRTNNNGVPLPTPELIPDLQRFASEGRQFIFAFDQDIKPTSKRKVAAALHQTAKLLQEYGCQILITQWDNCDGKGVDDYIVNKGINAWEKVYSEANTALHWYIRDRITVRLKKYKPTHIVNAPDLSTILDRKDLPDSGLVAVISDTGTGKTKKLAKTTHQNFVKLGHRRSLERNSAKRLNGHFINDTDYLQGKLISTREDRWINEAESKRKLLCFDSLLKTSVSDVECGDLILDEADQGLRHLLTSATCRKGGKRPLLLKHFEALVKAAKRVILLSATLSDREIEYIAQLRNEAPSMILLNKYQRPRGKCRYIHSSDDSVIMAEILISASNGERLIIVIDKLSKAKALANLLNPIIGKEAIFEFNSQTSGTEQGQNFADSPDNFFLANSQIKVAILTPSGFTGLSFEKPYFDKLFGVYYGQSVITDDCLQSPERVRDSSILRTIWAAKRGSAYSLAGDSTNAIEIKGNLKKRVDATAMLLRNELTPEKSDSIARYDWNNPHASLFAEYEAERNFSMLHFRECLKIALESSGYDLEVIEREADKKTRSLLKEAVKAVKLSEAIAEAESQNLTDAEAKELEKREDSLSPNDALALSKYRLAQWYCIPVEIVTTDDVLFDRKGRTRTELKRLENILFPDMAISYDTQKANQFGGDNDSTGTLWDFTHNEQERKALEQIGFNELLEIGINGAEWSGETEIVKSVGAKCRLYARDIKLVFRLTITDKMTDTQIMGELFRRVGLKTKSRRENVKYKRATGETGKTTKRFYSLDVEHLAIVRNTLKRRLDIRLDGSLKQESPHLATLLFRGGDYLPVPIDEPIEQHGKHRQYVHNPIAPPNLIKTDTKYIVREIKVTEFF